MPAKEPEGADTNWYATMKEFGSDYHYIDSYNGGNVGLSSVFGHATYLADGRMCMVALNRQYGWRRLWMPDYFCYEVIETIKKQTGIEVMFYADHPLMEGMVENLPFREGDVLLRMNFFGLRGVRRNNGIPVPVIEDHSHDPFGPWALCSDADWCVCSLRKTMPLPEGGVMWSPKRLSVGRSAFEVSEENGIRWEAMDMKAAYLAGEDIKKEEFRNKFTETEKWFDSAEPVSMDARSREFVETQFNFEMWFEAKRNNWMLLNELLNKEYCRVIMPESGSSTMYSLVLLMENREKRDRIRKRLIERLVYPAILWDLPKTASAGSRDFSERMLSIHCDGRYSTDEVRQLACIMNNTIRG